MKLQANLKELDLRTQKGEKKKKEQVAKEDSDNFLDDKDEQSSH